VSEEDYFPEHDYCEHCSDTVCRNPWCTLGDYCGRAGGNPDVGIWTAYQVHVHERCSEPFHEATERYMARFPMEGA
jgi:hypothetical protein